jgi:nucleoside-diphosphate-sugar epimerase
MKVLVTGANGLLGSHVVEQLLERGERPRALVRPGDDPGFLAHVDVDVRVGDVNDAAALEAAIDGTDVVVHCAARTGPWGPEREYRNTNVDALATLVSAARASGVRRIVHVSSITVHGNDIRGAGDETLPFRSEPNPYSRSKIAGELLLQRLIQQEGAPVTIVRPGVIYGPRDAASFARFATMIRDGRMVIFGSGRNHVPLVYAADVARGVLRAAESHGAEGRTYILVNDERVTQGDYLEAIARELDVPAPRRHVPYRVALTLGAGCELAARVTRRPDPPPLMRYGIQVLGGENRFSIERARREIGFEPHVTLADGVRRSVEWFRTEHDSATLARSG